MQTVVFNSSKGGSGKTTLCACLAVEAERAGHGPVFLLDIDPQGTLTTWHGKRVAESPKLGALPFDRLAAGLSSLRAHGAAFCFIDTPGHRPEASEDPLVELGGVDLVLVPVRPSAPDLWAAAETVERMQAQRQPFEFVLTQMKARATISTQIVAALSHHGPVAQSFIADRVGYATAFTDGRSPAELAPKGPAAQELAQLWVHLLTTLRAHPLRKEA